MFYKKWTLKKTLPYILIVCGLIGVYCSFVITQDKFILLEHPDASLNCSIDPILACGNIISSDQGHVFGFPNPFMGLAGFAAIMTVGVVMLAGATMKRWFWLLMQSGTLFALAFVHWLFFQSVYNIGNLCIYCMCVWVITITSFWYITLYNIDNKNITLPAKLSKFYPWVRRHHLDILIAWLLLIAFLVLKHFWYYYGTKF